jgi:molybdopterin-guanine dinucleotide biosynthesis protein A
VRDSGGLLPAFETAGTPANAARPGHAQPRRNALQCPDNDPRLANLNTPELLNAHNTVSD